MLMFRIVHLVIWKSSSLKVVLIQELPYPLIVICPVLHGYIIHLAPSEGLVDGSEALLHCVELQRA